MNVVVSGIGYATTLIVFLLNVYYNVILAWAFYYLFASFTSILPWSHCNNAWNTDFCIRSIHDIGEKLGSGFNNTTAVTGDVYTRNDDAVEFDNSSLFNATNITKWMDPTTEYWE